MLEALPSLTPGVGIGWFRGEPSPRQSTTDTLGNRAWQGPSKMEGGHVAPQQLPVLCRSG